ncbi:MAG TPA: histidine phosphatase family protein [Chloroflexota bacterium]|nr:histidine phosphatase family protein [Chloroflexota bacterium]
MLRLLLLRHGQTLWNKELRYNGDTDIELTALGQRQAAALAARLQPRHVDIVIASNLRRAISTAEPIASACRCSVRLDARWREVRFGDAEGLRWRDVVERFPLAARGWAENRPEAAMPGGESLLDVMARVQPALDELAAEFDNRTVAIVSHGGPLRVALCSLLTADITQHWRYNIAPCTLSEVAVYGSGGVLNVLNDACHLRAKGSAAEDAEA